MKHLANTYRSMVLLQSTIVILTILFSTACSDNSDSDNRMSFRTSSSSSSNETDNSFKAVINDFVGYDSWQMVDYAIGSSNPSIGGAHGGQQDNVMRKTYMNAIAANNAEEFAAGSIIIKEVFTYTQNENGFQKTPLEAGGLVAMVKRGGEFNADHNGWEWFVLAPDLSSVVAQGEDLMNGACNACHSKASMQTGGVDYVFAKPTEIILAADAFADYTSWDLIEFDSQPANLTNGAHVDDAAQRRVFQKQVLANPSVDNGGEYPIGTMVVKDISKDDQIQQIVAMVKRGGTFDSTNGNWEYFMLNPENPSQIATDETGAEVRGAIAMCIGCHIKATDELGTDFVFKHTDAPFNTANSGEFIAHKNNFQNYLTWSLTDYALGASNPFIGMAHSGTNHEFARAIFQNDSSLNVSGDQFPTGSILVKETFTTDDGNKIFAQQGGLLAMVKRGGTFNPDHNGWEWIMMSEDGDMLARGGDLMGGACNSCHAKATGAAGLDYSFNKPSEKIATLADFVDYASWIQIDETSGDSAANGGAHSVNSTRKTYKKPASASPYFEAQAYPVGTVLVKEIIVDGSLTQLYAMVKRGGNFNPEHGDWQWFLIDTDLSDITDLGDGPGCTGCHSKAGSDTETDPSFMGKDYVFYHPNDPVPMPVMDM